MRYFSFDAETDGLFGPVFAIGAVVMNQNQEILDQFTGVFSGEPIVDPWVRANCLPVPEDFQAYSSREALLNAFWNFYARHREDCTILADTPFPVEAGLLRACIDLDPQNRMQLSPYPVIDAASVFFAKGLDSDTDRMEFSGYIGRKHDPLADAIASAICVIRLLKEST